MPIVEIRRYTDTSNRYKVAIRQWQKWPPAARRIFNEVYSSMIGSPWAFLAPSMPQKPNPQAWRVTAWNAAWTAADAFDGELATAVTKGYRK